MVNSTLNGREIVKAGSVATCGHAATSLNGISSPTLNNLPIILTNSDLVGEGVIIPSNSHTATINNIRIAVDGESITNHGDSPHDNAIIIAS